MAPVANDDSFNIKVNNGIAAFVQFNDTDADGDLVWTTATVTSLPAHGTLYDGGSGTGFDPNFGYFSYFPDADWTGTDTFQYHIADAQGNLSNVATVTINVVPNQPPTATPDVYQGKVDHPLNLDPWANDNDPDGWIDEMSLTIMNPPTNGTAAYDESNFVYTPNPGFQGDDSFSYTILDNDGAQSNEVTVTLHIAPNQPPVAQNDLVAVKSNVAKSFDPLDNDYDPDGSLVVGSFTVLTPPSNGTLGFDPSTGLATYTPNTDYAGPDHFTYAIYDDDGAVSNTATVDLNVQPNKPPVAADDDLTVVQDEPTSFTPLWNDSDPDDDVDPASLAIVLAPANGSLSVDHTTGEVVYTPNSGYTGPDSFSYTITDPLGAVSNQATVNINVVPNVPPIAFDTHLYVDWNSTSSIQLASQATDPVGHLDFDSLQIVTSPAHGTLVKYSSYDYSYTPNANYAGQDEFTFRIKDMSGAWSNVATIRVTVMPGAIIGNNLVQLGVDGLGQLNISGPVSASGTHAVGLRYIPTNNDSTAPGCLCEGWGVAEAQSGVRGYANNANGTYGLELVSYSATATTFESTVRIIGTDILVTHNFHPSDLTPNLYEVTVTIVNGGSTTLDDLRYRRVMDWDIEPTAFDEYSTIQGTALDPRVLYASDNGFASSDPLSGRSAINAEGDFVDSGPADHGALFDFGLGSLAPGASTGFNIYYGAAGNEIDALAAIASVDAKVYSLGEPSTADGKDLGTPNTFIFAFGNLRSGGSNHTPTARDDSLSVPLAGTSGHISTAVLLSNDTDPDGDTLNVSRVDATSTQGGLIVLNPVTRVITYTPPPGFVGVDSFTYDASDGLLTDTATVHLDVQVDSKPAVIDFVVNDGSAQRSMVGSLTVYFSEPVTLDSGALVLTGPNGNVPIAVSPPGAASSFVVTFPSMISLDDGHYSLRVVMNSVHDSAGQPMSGDGLLGFHRFFGDSNGDGDTDATDYALFRAAARGGSSTYNPIFDYDHSGTLTPIDLAAFNVRMKKKYV